MTETQDPALYVAIVDDNPSDLTVAGLLVQKEGYQHRPFDNYPKLVKFLREERNQVKLILLDNDMPGLTGIDILKRLKKEPFFKDIPVVMMTGDSAPATVYRAVTGGAADYLVKPLNPTIFEEKIRKFIKPVGSSKAADAKPAARPQETACQNRIDLKFPGLVASIGEKTMTLKTEYRVGVGAKFVIDTPFLNVVGIKAVPLLVEECNEIAGGFHLKCAVGAMSEEENERMQRFYRSLNRAVPTAG